MYDDDNFENTIISDSMIENNFDGYLKQKYLVININDFILNMIIEY